MDSTYFKPLLKDIPDPLHAVLCGILCTSSPDRLSAREAKSSLEYSPPNKKLQLAPEIKTAEFNLKMKLVEGFTTQRDMVPQTGCLHDTNRRDMLPSEIFLQNINQREMATQESFLPFANQPQAGMRTETTQKQTVWKAKQRSEQELYTERHTDLKMSDEFPTTSTYVDTSYILVYNAKQNENPKVMDDSQEATNDVLGKNHLSELNVKLNENQKHC